MTFDIDSVPAPSEFDPVHLPRRHRYGFNGAVKLLNINFGRLDFHRWCKRFINMGTAHTENKWREHYQTFEAWEHYQRSTPNDDATDLHDTQQDSIAPPW